MLNTTMFAPFFMNGMVFLKTTSKIFWTLLYIIIELNKLTSLPICDFIAQLVGQRTGNAEVTGSNPVEALFYSGFFFPIA